MCGLGVVYAEGFHSHFLNGDGGQGLIDLDGQSRRMGHLAGGEGRPALDLIKALDYTPEPGIVPLELFMEGQREEEFSAGNAQLSIAAHGNGPGLQPQMVRESMGGGFIVDEVTGHLFAKGIVTGVDHIARNNPLNAVSGITSVLCQPEKTAHSVGCFLGQQFQDNSASGVHPEGHTGILHG